MDLNKPTSASVKYMPIMSHVQYEEVNIEKRYDGINNDIARPHTTGIYQILPAYLILLEDRPKGKKHEIIKHI